MYWFTSLFRALTKRERLTVTLATIGVIAGATGLGLTIFFKSTVPSPAEGGTYREGIVGQPASVNPVIAKSPADKALTALLFADLKELSSTVDIADQGKTIKVRLKEGLLWSDGKPITSDDVIFTIDRIKDADTDSPLKTAWQGITAERSSQLEVNFRMPAPYSFFEDTMRTLRPIPKHLYAEIPPANWKLSDYNIRPVGSGSFMFASRAVETDGFITGYRLRSNPKTIQKPYLEAIDISFYRNQAELIKAFNSGNIESFFISDPSALAEVKRPYHTSSFNSPTYYAVFWNQTAVSALASSKVREALDLAIDKQEIVTNILGEYGSISTDPLSPAFATPYESMKSLEKAQELLDEAGWKLNEDGIRSKTVKGNEALLEFGLTVPDIDYLVKTSDKLISSWTALGIKVRLEKMPLESILGGPIKNRTYEALLFGNTLTESGDLFPFWHSSGRLYPGLNLSLYQDKDVDKLISQIREESSIEKRVTEIEELRSIISKAHPALFLFSPKSIYVTGKNIKGIESRLITDTSDRFREASKWYMDTRRTLR